MIKDICTVYIYIYYIYICIYVCICVSLAASKDSIYCSSPNWQPQIQTNTLAWQVSIHAKPLSHYFTRVQIILMAWDFNFEWLQMTHTVRDLGLLTYQPHFLPMSPRVWKAAPFQTILSSDIVSNWSSDTFFFQIILYRMCTYNCLSTYTCIFFLRGIGMYIHTYVYNFTNYTYMIMYIYIYIYTHTYIYIYTHKYIYMWTYVCI